MHQRDIEREALEQERRRRKELERRLAQEIAKHNDVIEQAIRLREKEKLQVNLPFNPFAPQGQYVGFITYWLCRLSYSKG